MGGFSSIPGGFDESPHMAGFDDPVDLRALLRRTGMTQAEFARALGITQPFVSQIVNRLRPCPAHLREAAKALSAEQSQVLLIRHDGAGRPAIG
jgi:transcriptional regulator with XRE-family HTH domain